jgi:hypothetical protein
LSREEVADAELGAWQRDRGDGGLAPEHLDGPVAPAERRGRVRTRFAAHLEDAIHEIPRVAPYFLGNISGGAMIHASVTFLL